MNKEIARTLALVEGRAVVTVRTRNPDDWETLATPENQRRKRDYPITVLIDRMGNLVATEIPAESYYPPQNRGGDQFSLLR